MSANQYRGQLERKRQQRVDAEKKAGDYRSKESVKRAEAAKARAAAAKSSSSNTAATKLREAERRDGEAAAAGKDAARWQSKASAYAKEEAALAHRLARAERTEAESAERVRQREAQRAARQAVAEHAQLAQQIDGTRRALDVAVREFRPPKPEKLRVLLLGASADGELRVGREQKRIRSAVESVLHRNSIEFDVRPAATAGDLLDGVGRFRPHVIHFSGHSHTDLIEFEDDRDEPHDGLVVTASAFASAIAATDDPPLLVLLNSCHSAAQIENLVSGVVPFAIGMSDAIADAEAIIYAAQFYAAVANGQSIRSAHHSGQAALELAGLSGSELPTLAWAVGADPASAVLVHPVRTP